jgi:hypothetical protein
VTEDEAITIPEAFRIDSEDRANWLLCKLAGLDAEERRVKAQCETILKRVAAERSALEGRFGAELADWARQQIAGGKRRSLALLQGTIAFRRVPGGLTIADRSAVADTVRLARPDLIEQVVTERLDTTGARTWAEEVLRTTGEMLPGFEMREERESMSLRFGDGQEGGAS